MENNIFKCKICNFKIFRNLSLQLCIAQHAVEIFELNKDFIEKNLFLCVKLVMRESTI